MKILLYTDVFPYPLTEGGKVAQFHVLKQLACHHTILLVSKNVDSVLQQQLTNEIPGIAVCSITDRAINKREGIFRRILRTLHWELTKMVNKMNPASDAVLDNNLFVNPITPKTATFVEQWNEIVDSFQPDIFQTDFVDNADMAFLLKPSIKKVLVVHDLRYASVKQHLDNLEQKVYAVYVENVLRTKEIAALNCFDGLIVFSEMDYNKLADFIHPKKLFVSPFAVSESLFHTTELPAIAIKKLVFVGPEMHYPNKEGLIWFVENVFHQLSKISNLELHIVGNWSEEGKAMFSAYKGVKFLGFVDDVSAVMKDALMVVPLRIGSGIRTKIIEAFASGVPVISTSIGAEGLNARHLEHLFIADTAQEFVHLIEQIWDGVHNVQQLSVNARLLAQSQFSPQSVYERRNTIFSRLLNPPSNDN